MLHPPSSHPSAFQYVVAQVLTPQGSWPPVMHDCRAGFPAANFARRADVCLVFFDISISFRLLGLGGASELQDRIALLRWLLRVWRGRGA